MKTFPEIEKRISLIEVALTDLTPEGFRFFMEGQAPSEGFWYFVRFPDKWKLVPVRYDERPDRDFNLTHPEYWERELAPELGRAYGLDPYGIRELKELSYAFPRGRVGRGGHNMAEWLVNWGNNIPSGAPFNKRVVESYFGLTPDHRAKWQIDEHEVVAVDEKEAARKLLGIKEDWLGESVMGESCGVSILKESKPYGFWLSPGGEFHEVSVRDHEGSIGKLSGMVMKHAMNEGWIKVTVDPKMLFYSSKLPLEGSQLRSLKEKAIELGLDFVQNAESGKAYSSESVSESKFSRVANILRGTVPSIRTVGIITAENPMGQTLSSKENKELNDKMEAHLRRGNFFGYHQVIGKYGVIEHPFLIPNMKRDYLLQMGKWYEQKAVIYGYSAYPQDGYAKMVFEYWGDRDTVEENFQKTSERSIFVSVGKEEPDFYTEVQGRKFVIPFFDKELNGTDWVGGAIVRKSEVPKTPQAESLVKEIERRLNEDFSDKVGLGMWGNRGILWNKVDELKEIL